MSFVSDSGLGSRVDSLKALRYYLQADLRSRSGRSLLRGFMADPLARFTILMRVLEYLQQTRKPALVRLPIHYWYKRLAVRLGFTISTGIFGPGVAIVHYGLLVINPATRIGRNCRVHAGVNIGATAKMVQSDDEGRYTPLIGHNVYIGPGAKLFGPITIGDDCTIGANAVVTKSFPETGLTLAGVPAEVIGTGGTGERLVRGAG